MIILRYLIKNFFSKKLRTLMLVFCMMMCSVVGIFGLDMIREFNIIIDDIMSEYGGDSTFTVFSSGSVSEPVSLSFENEQLLLYGTSGAFISYTEDEYAFYHRTDYKIYTADYSLANRMGMLPEELSLSDGETAISSALSKASGLSEGDTLTLYDSEKNPVDFKITGVIKEVKTVNGMMSVFISEDSFKKLTGRDKLTTGEIYISIADKKYVSEAEEELKAMFRNGSVINNYNSKEIKEARKSVIIIFGILFAICFLLVIFVAVSVANRNVSERMGVIGTFRSLGMSPSFAVTVLLMENGLYGLVGGAAGIGLYGLARPFILESFGDLTENFPPLSFLSCIIVIAASMAIMMACPIKETVRTSGMAIRDIIFDNKDTEYRMEKSTKITGFALLAVTLVAALSGSSTAAHGAAAYMVSVIAGIFALSMLFPYILKGLSLLFAEIFRKAGKPVARLAALEIYTKKSTVGSSVLCVTSAAMAFLLFFIGVSMSGEYVSPYGADVVVTPAYRYKTDYYSYIDGLEGVESTETVFGTQSNVKIKDNSVYMTVIGLPDEGFRLFTGISNCPPSLGTDAFAADEAVAEKNGLKVGDKVTVIFNDDGFLPIEKELTLAAVCDFSVYDKSCNDILVSKDLFVSIYHEYPSFILVKCSDPKGIKEKIDFYSGATIYDCQTVGEIREEAMEDQDEMNDMLIGIICFGIALTLVGMISNQIVGFEGRRRECAVLSSVAMTKGDVASMFFIESALAAFFSLISAFAAALLMYGPVTKIMILFGNATKARYDFPKYFLCLAVMWAVFTAIVVLPVIRIKRMVIADQLKYE